MPASPRPAKRLLSDVLIFANLRGERNTMVCFHLSLLARKVELVLMLPRLYFFFREFLFHVFGSLFFFFF